MDSTLYKFLHMVGYDHRFHPVLTHLVIGPVIAALIFSLIAWIFRRQRLHQTARHLTVFGLVFGLLAVLVGIIDWIHFYNASLIRAVLVKLIVAFILLVLLAVTVALNQKLAETSPLPLVMYAAMSVCVGLLGYFGAELARH